jgi:DNA-binding NarL/FixJ family response regulator
MSRTVLIVDDQVEFRLLARQLLELDGFVVVGEAVDAQSAVAAERQLSPDVVLMDVRLGSLPGDGLSAARAIRDRPSSAAVVLTSTADYQSAVARCGATGFVPKAELSGPRLHELLDSS